MPRLPDVYAQRPIGDGRRPIAAVRNAGAVGGAIVDAGRNVSQVGDALFRLEEQAREEETAAAAADGDVLASTRIREALYDPEKGYLNASQFAAVSGRQKALDDLGALRDEVLKGLPEEAAKRLRPVLQNRIETAMRQVDTHASGERRAWLDAASLARMGMASDDALARFQSPEDIDHHLRVGLSEFEEYATRKGMSPDERAMEREKYISDTLKRAVFRRAQDDPAGAMAYARENAERLAAADMAHIESVVGGAAKEFEGRAWADRAMSASGPFSMDGYLGLVTKQESGNDPTARNPRSSAGGLGQFIDGTWLETVKRYAPHVAAGKSDADLIAMKTDASVDGQAFHMRMLRHFTQENIATLATAGVPVNAGTAYMAHHFGAVGAVRILKELAAGRDVTLDRIDAAAVKANPHLAGRSLSSVRDWAFRAVGFTSDPLVAAAGINDPVVRDAAMDRVEQAHRIEASQIQRARREAQEMIWQSVEDGTDPRLLPPEVREAAGLDVVRAMENYYDEKAAGFSIRTDPELYTELLKEAYGQPEAFRGRELLADRDRLSEGDFRRLTEMQAQIQKGEPPQSVSFTEAHRMWRSAGIEQGQSGSDQAQEFARLELAYVDEWAGFVAQNGRQPGVTEQLAIARRVAPNSPLWGKPREMTGFTGSAAELRSAAEPVLRAAELWTPTAGSAEAKAAAAFHAAHQMEAQAFVALNGRQPTSLEAAEMARKMARSVILDTGRKFGPVRLFDDPKMVFQVTQEDIDALQAGEVTLVVDGQEVPFQALNTARRALKREGNPDPSFADVVDLAGG